MLLPQYIYASVKIEIDFGGDVPKIASGVLFKNRKKTMLVTARHCIEPKFKDPRDTRMMQRLRVFYRALEDVKGLDLVRIGYSMSDWQMTTPILSERDNDCCALPIDLSGPFPEIALDHSVVASEKELATLLPGEAIAFSGYPRGAPKSRVSPGGDFDEVVLRTGVCSVAPGLPIDIQDVLGDDYGLIDSYAQSGFSGAPLWSMPRSEVIFSNGLRQPAAPTKLIGLVCAHYRSNEDRADGLHSGLSYFVRATSIASALSIEAA
jgi:hypothetical protein